MVAVELVADFTVAEASTAELADFTVAEAYTAELADFVPAGSMAALVDFTGDLLDFLMAGFTAANFTLTDLTASTSTTMASKAAYSWPLRSAGCGGAAG